MVEENHQGGEANDMIPSTRAMMKSKKGNGTVDMEKAKFLSIISDILNASFGKSTGFHKATVLAGPDLYSAHKIYNRLGEEGLRRFVGGLAKRYPDRISITNEDKLLGMTPWADKQMYGEGNNYSHPDAIAIPQDYWGYVVQPGDPHNNWGKLLVNPSDLDKLYDDYMPHSSSADFGGSVRGFGVRAGTWDEDIGEDYGFVFRPGQGSKYRKIGSYASRYPQNVSNANIAFESGKKTGINGPLGEKRAISMLVKQYLDAYHSNDADTRRAAKMYGRYLRYLQPTWYNPRSYHLSGTNEVALRSPEQVMNPSHGMPGSSFWEETLHGIDNTIGENIGNSFINHLSSVNPIILNALKDDFSTKFQGDPGKVTEHAEKIINGWQNPNGGRYADDHEYIELLNLMHQAGTDKNAPGVLGSYANHPIRDGGSLKNQGYDEMLTEAFNSLTNGRMTNNKKGIEKIKNNLPHADKAAGELYKQALDIHKDASDKDKESEFNLGPY